MKKFLIYLAVFCLLFYWCSNEDESQESSYEEQTGSGFEDSNDNISQNFNWIYNSWEYCESDPVLGGLNFYYADVNYDNTIRLRFLNAGEGLAPAVEKANELMNFRIVTDTSTPYLETTNGYKFYLNTQRHQFGFGNINDPKWGKIKGSIM